MPSDFLPTRDADLALWTANFASLTTASPTTYGLTAPEAMQYATLDSIWQAALAAATDPSTRTIPTVAAKDVAKANVRAYSRQLGAAVQAWPSITPTLLADLGLTIRDTGRTPVPPPTTYPLVSILSTAAHAALVALADQNTPNARRKPDGVAGAEMFVSFGTTPPTGIDQMTYVGLQTRYPQNWDLGVGNTGKMAWLIARWINRKGQRGPISSPVGSIVA